MRNLKLEKTDLYLQNLQMKKMSTQHQLEKHNNEQKMNEMQQMLLDMQKQLKEKDGIILQT